MKSLYYTIILTFLLGCKSDSENPFFNELNAPIDYANVSANHIEEYARFTFTKAAESIETIKQNETPTFESLFIAFDDIINDMTKANNNCFMLYWVSPDSLSRANGLAGYQMLDSLATSIYADKLLYKKIVAFSNSDSYDHLKGHRKNLVDDLILDFEQSGVKLDPEQLTVYKKLVAEINQLSSEYSVNMNTANEVLTLDEQGAEGLPENFKTNYATGEFEYEIPVISATRLPVMSNAKNEETRKVYLMKYQNRAADKNLTILDAMVKKRYEIARLMDHESYASYNLSAKMAGSPGRVWEFINDLLDRTKSKAIEDHETLKNRRNMDQKSYSSDALNPWDFNYYKNQILKTQFQVDHEKIREYLPMEQCLTGLFVIYQELLGLEFRKVENPSVWHEEVEMSDVYEGKNLRGRFYLDLFPRPNKESWFYGVSLTEGKATDSDYEVPVSMLLGNFTRPTESLPSLLSHRELNTLFHEFGHIVNGMSYNGEFMMQANSKADFVESMSQIFENWTWDYETLSSFAMHYETGEVLPKEMFDNMLNAKNVSAGLQAQFSLRSSVYDMMLYHKYDPENPVNTDDIWRNIDQELSVMPTYIEDTHPQASWIHINTHPVYYYGYSWSRVYAQDMFTEFEKNGLRDTETGMRYRKLILANGTQRDIVEAVEEFLGRPSNNEAYIRSLGL